MGKFFIGLSFLMIIMMFYVMVKYPFMKIDEGYTMGMVKLPMQTMISVTAGDVHSPLYYAIVMFFIGLVPFKVDLIYLMKFVSVIPYFIIILLSLTKIKSRFIISVTRIIKLCGSFQGMRKISGWIGVLI